MAGSRLCNMAIQRKRPLVSAIADPGDILLPLPPDLDIRSFLGVPIVFGDHAIGLVALYNSGDRAFTEEDARVAELFASQVAIALDNSRRVEQFEKLAVTDELTGLYNRRAFASMGEKEVGRARRYQRPLALILFDIDHFKDVNDSYGHLFGDHVLRVLTERVTRTTRTTDIVCRYGGEEFIVLMPEAGRDEALAMAERLRQEISGMTIVTAGRHAVADDQPGRRRARPDRGREPRRARQPGRPGHVPGQGRRPQYRPRLSLGRTAGAML